MPYSPSDVAKLLDVSPSTVRSYTAQYSEHLAPAARGEAGDRQYDERDIAVLHYVAQLRSEGMSRNAIALRLRETSFGEAETLVTQATATPTQSLAEATGHATDAAQAFALATYVQTALQAQQDALDRRLDALERQQRTALGMLVTGFVLGLIFALLLLSLALYVRL